MYSNYVNDNFFKTTKFKPTTTNYISNNTITNYTKIPSMTEYKKPETFEELQQQNSEALKRNQERLKQNQNSILNCYLHLTHTNPTLIDYQKYNLGEYLNKRNPMIYQNNINEKILTKQNELLALESVLQNQSEQNKLLFEEENEYCNKMQKMNEDLLNRVKELANKNDDIIYQRKLLWKKNNLMEQEINNELIKLMNRKQNEPPEPIMEFNKIEIEDEKEEEEVKTEVLRSSAKKDFSQDTESDEEIKEKKKQYLLLKEEIYQLNMNHNPGKLDEIRKKKLEQMIEEQQKQIENLYKQKKKKAKLEKPIKISSQIYIEQNENEKEIDLNKDSNIKKFKASIKKDIDDNSDLSNENMRVSNEYSNLENLNSKKIKIEDKEKVLDCVIKKIEDYADETGEYDVIYNQNVFENLNQNKPYLKKIFYQILNDPNTKTEIKFLVQLLFEILNSNYNFNINDEKLRSKNEYNYNDFQEDLNENYLSIFTKIVEHLKKMIQMKRCSRDFGAQFLSKAIMNFEYNNEMLSRLFDVIEPILAE